MKLKYLFLTVFIVLFHQVNLKSQALSQPSAVVGEWMGMLENPGSSNLHIIFIIKMENDSLRVALKSPDQGSGLFSANNITYKNNNLSFEIRRLGVKYNGVFNGKDTSIVGTFNQGDFSGPLDLKPFKLNRPQEPHPPFPYIALDVTFKNEKAGITLSGTLTLPSTGGPFPAVVLITGSGPEDRNEEVFGHKPFLVLSDYLTRNGIAVLRFDDRGVGKSTGHYRTATMEDFSTDVVSAVQFLRVNSNIDKTKIGLIGHSEGGTIAPMIASSDTGIAFIVLMAGMGIPGDQLLLLQAEKIDKLKKVPADVIDLDKKIKVKIFKEIRSGKDSATVAHKIVKLYTGLKPAEKQKLNFTEDKIPFILASFLNPEIMSLIKSDPAAYLKKVKCPVLAIDGEKDVQVPAKENLKGIEEALKSGGNKNYTVKELWLLNHMFQTADTGAVGEYEQIDETIAVVALDTINDWIQLQVKAGHWK